MICIGRMPSHVLAAAPRRCVFASAHSMLARVRRWVTIGLAAVGALAIAALAAAQVEDKISLRATGGNDHAHLSPALMIAIVLRPSTTGAAVTTRTAASGGPPLPGDRQGEPRRGQQVRLDRRRRDSSGRHARRDDREPDSGLAGGVRGPAADQAPGRRPRRRDDRGHWLLTRSPFGGADDARMKRPSGSPSARAAPRT